MRTKKYWRRMRYLEDEEILEEEEILEGEEMLEENEILEEEEVLEEEEMFEVEERREEVVEGDDGKMGAAEFERGEKVGGGEAGEMVREASEAGGEGGGQGGHRVRELPKKKCSFNLDFVQNRSDPPPDFWIFWYTFPKVKTFGTFGTLLCILIHPIFWQKVSQNFWIWSNPPPFLPKIPKMLVHKKCPKTFGLLRNPPPPYGRSPN